MLYYIVFYIGPVTEGARALLFRLSSNMKPAECLVIPPNSKPTKGLFVFSVDGSLLARLVPCWCVYVYWSHQYSSVDKTIYLQVLLYLTYIFFLSSVSYWVHRGNCVFVEGNIPSKFQENKLQTVRLLLSQIRESKSKKHKTNWFLFF